LGVVIVRLPYEKAATADLVSTILAFYRHNLCGLVIVRRKLLGRRAFWTVARGWLPAGFCQSRLAEIGHRLGVLGLIVHRRVSEKTQTRRVAFGAAAAAVCLATSLSACSPGADYPTAAPTLFPAIHDMPPPRAEAPLNPVQVQQATEDLISERDRLNGGTQGAAPQGTAKSQPARVQPVSQTTTSNGAGATTAGGQAAGIQSK
jgi:hypothetical protein